MKNVSGTHPVVRFDGVSKIYTLGGEKVFALNDVSFSIQKGEFVAIMGPSGSGKSTAMNMIGCLDRPTKGTVTVGGRNVNILDPDSRARIRGQLIGFIFQNFNLLQTLSAWENVSMPMLFQGVPKDERQRKAKEVLERVGLGDRLDHRPTELSGGQQQRVAIARALVGEPEVILADEPTGNLDSVSGKQILEMFKRLHKEGRTLIMVTHDAKVANNAKRVIHLKDGKVFKDGVGRSR